MKVSGIDYGLLPSWEIEVPDSAIVVENTTPERIPPALEDPAKAVLEAIRNPLGGVKPLADHVTSSSKVTIAINDWMGISVHAVPVVLEEPRAAGVDERNIQIVVAGGLHPKMSRRDLYLTKVGRDINPPYPSPFHILPPEVIDRFWPSGYGSSRIRPHDASDREHLVELGVTEYGDLVEMNDCVVESDLVIYMSGWSGLPSIWGGYLGGGQGVTVGVGSFVEQTTGKKVFYIEGSINARAEFVQVVAGAGAAIREPIFELADNEKIIDIPEQVDVFISGAAHWGVFYDQVNNPLMSLVQINSRIREYVGDRPPLRQGGVAIFVTPCDGTIDERFRPSDHEMLALFDRLGHDPARLEDYEEEYAHREDLIAKYRFAGGAHPLHPFPVFYENSFILDLTSRIIFAGARSARAAQLVGATAVPTFEDAWQLACKTLGTRDPSVMVTPGVGARMPLLWRVNGGVRGAQERDPGQGAS